MADEVLVGWKVVIEHLDWIDREDWELIERHPELRHNILPLYEASDATVERHIISERKNY